MIKEVTRKLIRDDLPILPRNRRVTKIGVIERMGELDWTSPSHITYAHKRPQVGIRGPRL